MRQTRTTALPTFGEVLMHGEQGRTKEYPPDSGETCILYRYGILWYAVPVNDEAYALSDPADPYLS